MKTNYNVKLNYYSYKAGDPVWLHNSRLKKGLCKKLQKAWIRPVKVIDKINDVLHRVRTGPHRRNILVVKLDEVKLNNIIKKNPILP